MRNIRERFERSIVKGCDHNEYARRMRLIATLRKSGDYVVEWIQIKWLQFQIEEKDDELKRERDQNQKLIDAYEKMDFKVRAYKSVIKHNNLEWIAEEIEKHLKGE